MSTAVTAASATRDETVTAARRPPPPRTPFGRIVRVELRKMFDTRSGFWLMASIVLLSVVATGATLVFVDSEDLAFEDSDTVSGKQFGGGFELGLTKMVYAKAEYMHSRFNNVFKSSLDDPDNVNVRRHQVLLGVGVRFGAGS